MSDPSEAFRAMDQRIQLNVHNAFGGAVVIVPPGGGKAIELLMLDAAEDEGQFWATILTRIQTAIHDSDQKKIANRSFGAR
jgi:hypothetical protein